MEAKRIDYFDIAKGISMLCVIIGHLSVSKINMIVFTFHMPLFFIISGYFTKKQGNKALAVKKFKQLLVPYIATCIAVILCSAIKDIFAGNFQELINHIILWCYAAFYGSGNSYTAPFFVKAIGAIWFLPAMFWAILIYNLIADKKWSALWVACIAGLGYVSVNYVYLPWSIQSAMLAIVFIHTGYYFRKKNYFETMHIWSVTTALLLWGSCIYIDRGRFYLVGNYSEHLLVDIIGSIAGTYLVVGFSKIIQRFSMVSFALKWFGKYSLIVLCFHLIELTFIPWKDWLESAGITNILLIGGIAVAGKLIWCTTGVLLTLNMPFLSAIFGIKNSNNPVLPKESR